MRTGHPYANFFPDILLPISVSNWIATVFRIGYLPLAPGTWCSFVAVLFWYFFMINILPIYLFVISLAVFFLGIIASSTFLKETNDTDPSEIVIDELSGQWLALVGIPHTIGFAIASFIIFRILDILKPFPIRQIEKYPGSWGVMLDDLAAGALTVIILNFYIFFK